MFEMVDDKGQKALIKVIGVGGCGGNAVDFMIEKKCSRRRIHMYQY